MRIINTFLIAIIVAFAATPCFAKVEIPQAQLNQIASLCAAEFSLESAIETCTQKEIKAVKWMYRFDKKFGDDTKQVEIKTWCEDRTKNEAAYEKMFRLKRCIRRRNYGRPQKTS